MAGTNPDFNAGEFRTAIKEAMTMGQPATSTLQATFKWPENRSFLRQDSAGDPWDWTANPITSTQHADVQIPVAVEYQAQNSGAGTSIGFFSNARAVITVLDEDYALIEGATMVMLGDDTYDIVARQADGLFDVTVWTIFADARSTP